MKLETNHYRSGTAYKIRSSRKGPILQFSITQSGERLDGWEGEITLIELDAFMREIPKLFDQSAKVYKAFRVPMDVRTHAN